MEELVFKKRENHKEEEEEPVKLGHEEELLGLHI